jgi:hypothetical protein
MGVSDEVRGQLAVKFGALFPHERQRRLLMGAEARVLGHDGIRAVARAAQVSETTVRKGMDELEAGEEPLGRVRRPGGGRKKAVDLDPGLRPHISSRRCRSCGINTPNYTPNSIASCS